ncbi:SGNH/GDSL hydrolase family protein [Bacterioplanoides sp. SCSIO 12839]|uniref:SGNH/GDSL hydrolase family protein n=1 Tax=Bacterioplanoides sp. SCSIO 12839 TaxID=2829569 RepID=UPI002103A98D|nr:SGNH/GDSL hydrolase family protein [Bacterioplanoides sp. SCSIO 12839]UTW46893.1 SGNH/GDSL hydrolase family protein [Bacterioplanoides sp. SCSIO 12839]
MLQRLPLLLSYSGYCLLAPLLPLIIWQGKNTRKTALRLPEADGPRSGEFNSTIPTSLDILHLGESTVAGVGVHHSNLGFTANISRVLAENNVSHQWQYIAQTGVTMQELIALLNQQQAIPGCSHLIISMGVNDTTNFTRRHHWRENLIQLVNQVKVNSPKTQVYFTQVAPMHRFPALAKPLNYFLGLRAWQLNHELKSLCADNDWQFISIDIPLQPEWMAKDGYHPNNSGYELWGQGVAQKIME